MKKTIYLDGKRINSRREIPKNAKLTRVVSEEFYETPEYKAQKLRDASEYFDKQRRIREDMDMYHG